MVGIWNNADLKNIGVSPYCTCKITAKPMETLIQWKDLLYIMNTAVGWLCRAVILPNGITVRQTAARKSAVVMRTLYKKYSKY